MEASAMRFRSTGLIIEDKDAMNGLAFLLTSAAILALLPEESQAQQGKITTSPSRAVAFLKAVPSSATLAQIKNLLPPGTTVKMPDKNAFATASEAGYGTHIRYEGTFSGILLFFSEPQKRAFKASQASSNGGNNPAMKYRPSDPVNEIHLFLYGSKDEKGVQQLKQLTALLGKPRKKEFLGMDNDHANGWTAEWRLRDGRTIIYLASQDGAPLLSLRFPYFNTPRWNDYE
jgi:hypothetical protein